MPPTRLVLAGLPPLLRSIVSALALDRPALEVVAEVGVEEDLVAVAGAHGADAVLVPASAADVLREEQILSSRPRLRLLVLEDDGRRATLHRLLPDRVRLDDVSPDELFDALLGVGRYTAPEWWP